MSKRDQHTNVASNGNGTFRQNGQPFAWNLQTAPATLSASVHCARIRRPDQANRVAAGTSASSGGVVHGTGCQSNKAGLRRSGNVFGLDPAYAVRNCG
jgi:hypothetical protein